MSAPAATPAFARRLRVAHYGSGSTGRHVLHAILQRPDLELAAQLVHTPAKVGLDAGEIVGLPPSGVRATANFEDFLAADADCVTYCAADAGRSPLDLAAEIGRLLASGKNVVSTSAQFVYAPDLPSEVHARLAEACRIGGASFFATGIGPGLANDVLTVLCTSACDDVRSVSAQERLLSKTYPYSGGVFAAMGFGLTEAEFQARFGGPIGAGGGMGASTAMVAQALGLQLDEIRGARDCAVTPREIVAAGGVVRPGHVAAVRFRYDGYVNGAPVVRFTRISSLSDDPIDDWEPRISRGGQARRITQITIDADPMVHCAFELTGSGIPGEEATAHRAVNAIRTVCEAEAGVKHPLNLPLFGGRGARP